MQSLKRLFILFSILLFITGCAQPQNTALTFSVGGTPAELDFWETICSDFTKQTGIPVSLLRQPTDSDQRRQGLVIPLEAKKHDPDVFLMDVAWIAQFAASDWLQSLNKYIKMDNYSMEPFFPKIIKMADTFNGQLVALPVYIDGGLLYYRKDLIKAPPKTWQKLVELSLEQQKKRRKDDPSFYGFVWQGAQYEGLICNFLEVAGSNQGGLTIKDEYIPFDSTANIEAAEFMADLIHKYKISPPSTFTEMKEEQVRSYFQEGNALFERNWPYAWSLHQAQGSKVRNKVGIAPLPAFPGGHSVSTLGGWHVGINKFSDKKAAAFKFIKFLTSYKTQKTVVLNLGWNPGRRDLYTDKDILKEMPHFKELKHVFAEAIPRPNVPYYTQLSKVMQLYLNQILSGKTDTKTAMQTAEKELQKVIKRYAQ